MYPTNENNASMFRLSLGTTNIIQKAEPPGLHICKYIIQGLWVVAKNYATVWLQL
jgi:hypothetical protein